VSSTLRDDLRRIYEAAIAAAAPAPLIGRAFEGETPAGETVAELCAAARRIFVIAAGKAAIPMARELTRRCRPKLAAAMAAAPADPAAPGSDDGEDFAVVRGAHPLPDPGSIRAAEAALELAHAASAGDLLIVALSGGASAIMAAPAPGISLADKIAVTDALMRAGAPIRELNTVRKHLSAVKGGCMLAAVNGARVVTLILSDVIGNDPATIGSGPTVADPSTFAEAVAIMKRRKLWGRAPEPVRDLLERGVAGEVAETLKPGDARTRRSSSAIVGDNGTAIDGAERAALALGYRVRRWNGFSGEAEAAGRAAARELAALETPRSCIVAGGETVVTMRGAGRGGRAQHCALAGAIELARGGMTHREAALLVAGSDGIDGPTEAAGAFADPGTVERAHAAGLDPDRALAQNDSYTLFSALDDLLITGPTGTNVADLLIGVVGA
jgi:glycerate 2-kinase